MAGPKLAPVSTQDADRIIVRDLVLGKDHIRSRHRLLSTRQRDIKVPGWFFPGPRARFHYQAPWWVPAWWRHSYHNLTLVRCISGLTYVVHEALQDELFTVADLQAFLKRTPLAPALRQKFIAAIHQFTGDADPEQPRGLEEILRKQEWWSTEDAATTICRAIEDGTIKRWYDDFKIEEPTVRALISLGFMTGDFKIAAGSSSAELGRHLTTTGELEFFQELLNKEFELATTGNK